MFLLINGTKVGAQYWQQFVDYKIDVDLNPETAIYYGTQTVEYKNNSPETLKKVFFHLYFNAFQPGSEMAVQQKNSPDRNRRFKVYVDSLNKDQQGYLKVSDLTQDGVRLETVASETILEVPLNTPIPLVVLRLLVFPLKGMFQMLFGEQEKTLLKGWSSLWHNGTQKWLNMM